MAFISREFITKLCQLCKSTVNDVKWARFYSVVHGLLKERMCLFKNNTHYLLKNRISFTSRHIMEVDTDISSYCIWHTWVVSNKAPTSVLQAKILTNICLYITKTYLSVSMSAIILVYFSNVFTLLPYII